MRLDTIQSLVIILMVALATQITRWTPFLLFSGERKLPRVVEDLGKLLPPAMMGLLVVYSLRSTDLLGGSHGIPEAIVAVILTPAVCIPLIRILTMKQAATERSAQQAE